MYVSKLLRVLLLYITSKLVLGCCIWCEFVAPKYLVCAHDNTIECKTLPEVLITLIFHL